MEKLNAPFVNKVEDFSSSIHDLITQRKLKEHNFRVKLFKHEKKLVDLFKEKNYKFTSYLKNVFKEKNLLCKIVVKNSSIHFIYNQKSILQLNIIKNKDDIQVYCVDMIPFFYFKQGEISNQALKVIKDIYKVIDFYFKKKDIIISNINNIHLKYFNKAELIRKNYQKDIGLFYMFADSFDKTISKKITNILLKDLSISFKQEKFNKLTKNVPFPQFTFDEGFKFDELERIKLIKINSNKYDVYIYPPKCIKPLIMKDISKSHIKNLQFNIK